MRSLSTLDTTDDESSANDDLRPDSGSALTRALLRWYRSSGRHDLPWRNTKEPWAVLLAELMLQRTRADLVVPIYKETLRRYPTPAALADAHPTAAETLMRPLGLAHRLPRLQAAAAACRNRVPQTYDELMKVPGVGPYAATATLCLAFGKQVAVVDPTVIRVLERLGVVSSDRSRPRSDPKVWAAAQRRVPPRRARDWNLAILDLGALVCRPKPRCPECPLLRWCPTGQSVTGKPPRVIAPPAL